MSGYGVDPGVRQITGGVRTESSYAQGKPNVNYKGDRAHNVARQMSRAQYDAIAHTMNTGGGFSKRAVGDRVGAVASDAYMAAGYAPEGHLSTPVDAQGLKGYVTENLESLQPEGRYLGGWGSSLDVSQAFPRTDKGLLGATFQGITRGQDAIGEVARGGDYVRDIDTASGMMSTPKLPAEGPSIPGHEPDQERLEVEDLKYRTPANRELRSSRPQ